MTGVVTAVPKLAALRALRESRFLTQGDLAEQAGVSRQTVNRIEQGDIEPRFRTVRALAKALGVEPSELVGEADSAK